MLAVAFFFGRNARSTQPSLYIFSFLLGAGIPLCCKAAIVVRIRAASKASRYHSPPTHDSHASNHTRQERLHGVTCRRRRLQPRGSAHRRTYLGWGFKTSSSYVGLPDHCPTCGTETDGNGHGAAIRAQGVAVVSTLCKRPYKPRWMIDCVLMIFTTDEGCVVEKTIFSGVAKLSNRYTQYIKNKNKKGAVAAGKFSTSYFHAVANQNQTHTLTLSHLVFGPET